MERKMKSVRLRMVGILDKEGKSIFSFSELDGESHRTLFQGLLESKVDRDFDIPVYGRFYSLLAGNSKYPVLVIYGESSDYRLEDLGHHQDKYENHLREFAFNNKYDILFLS